MDIVACTDEGFVMPTGVMMYSVCVNNIETDIVFHVVTNGVSSEDKRKLSDTVSRFKGKSVIFYDAKRIDSSWFPPISKDYSRMTLATYYRLFLTELLPSNLNKVLYLDGDIIVRKSLIPLWETDLENQAVAASPDDFINKKENYDRLNYPIEKGYFNAGVLLINLDYWRKNNLLGVFMDFLQKYADRIKWWDQDVLNYSLRDCKKYFPIKYNLHTVFLLSGQKYDNIINQETKEEIQEAINDCVILHFTGTNPWYTTCQHPYRSTFFKYQSQTIWKDTPLIEKRPLSWRIKKRLGWVFRKLNLLPELPPYGKQFMDGLTPID